MCSQSQSATLELKVDHYSLIKLFLSLFLVFWFLPFFSLFQSNSGHTTGQLIIQAEVMRMCNDAVVLDFRAQEVEKKVKNHIVCIKSSFNSFFPSRWFVKGFYGTWALRSLFGHISHSRGCNLAESLEQWNNQQLNKPGKALFSMIGLYNCLLNENQIIHSCIKHWRRQNLPVTLICNGDYDRPLLIQVFDEDSGSDEFIGEFQVISIYQSASIHSNLLK